VILAIIVSVLLKLSIILPHYSAAPSNFGGGDAAFIDWTIVNGRFPTGDDIPVYSVFGAQIGHGAEDKTYFSLVVSFSLLLGVDYYSWTGIVAFAVISSAFLLGIVLGWLRLLCPPHVLRYATPVVALYVVAGSPILIGHQFVGNAVYAWGFLLLALYLALRRHRNRWTTKHAAIFIAFSITVATFYFTAATAYLMILVVAQVQAAVHRSGARNMEGSAISIRSANYFLAFVVVWLGYSMYIALARFGSIADLIARLPTLLSGFSSSVQTAPYASTTSIANKIRVGFNASMCISPLLVVAFLSWRSRGRESGLASATLGPLPFAIVPFALITYAGIGSLGYALEYAVVFSLALFPFLLSVMRRPMLVALVVAVAAASGTIAFAVDENHPLNYVSYREESAAIWIAGFAPPSVGVFTDFRLSGPLIGVGHMRTTGVNEQGQDTTSLILELMAIYYSDDADSAIWEIRNSEFADGSSPTLIFLSSAMTEPVPGVRTYGHGFVPPDADSFGKFESSPVLSQVYSNGEAVVFYIRP
jgi:hypothetical protein